MAQIALTVFENGNQTHSKNVKQVVAVIDDDKNQAITLDTEEHLIDGLERYETTQIKIWFSEDESIDFPSFEKLLEQLRK